MLFNPLIEHAIELSAQWHDHTYRKSRWRERAFEIPETERLQVPVMAHVTTVAMTVQRAGWDDATVAAAFLHDVVEDANRYGQALREEELRGLLGDAVADRVMEVTERKYDADGTPRPWRARKEGYFEGLRRGTPGGAAISLADKLHNLWTINEALVRGIDVFSSAAGRKGLSAGPDEQLWFHRAVLEATRVHDDERLEPMRERLVRELERFEQLVQKRSRG